MSLALCAPLFVCLSFSPVLVSVMTVCASLSLQFSVSVMTVFASPVTVMAAFSVSKSCDSYDMTVFSVCKSCDSHDSVFCLQVLTVITVFAVCKSCDSYECSVCMSCGSYECSVCKSCVSYDSLHKSCVSYDSVHKSCNVTAVCACPVV